MGSQETCWVLDTNWNSSTGYWNLQLFWTVFKTLSLAPPYPTSWNHTNIFRGRTVFFQTSPQCLTEAAESSSPMCENPINTQLPAPLQTTLPCLPRSTAAFLFTFQACKRGLQEYFLPHVYSLKLHSRVTTTTTTSQHRRARVVLCSAYSYQHHRSNSFLT